MKKLLIFISFFAFAAVQAKEKKKAKTGTKHHISIFKKKKKGHKDTTLNPIYLAPNVDTISVSASDSNNINHMLTVLESELGKPYRRGAIGPERFDCSGLIKYGFSHIGWILPRRATDIGQLGETITTESCSPGDLLFFSGRRRSKSKSKRISHVGCVYKVEDGNIFMIHSSDQGVNITNITHSKYYQDRFIYAKRLFEADTTFTAPQVVPLEDAGN
ncbi:NlpC/P60 family protein [Chitinophaga sp. CF118]|uniref:C40 family peptidase n=1 Tax=Chitinophaga sp. CF118 TaxID=1884367 RepID=UPI0008EFB4C1|nr:C40 family peptidase [Chitinophaga sp. CF118]SFE90740.1 NlpC/P60 family protein [Chitinophaga sp. CF118]